eukprot:1159404-Pelagomonas_calceolata.AAC.11
MCHGILLYVAAAFAQVTCCITPACFPYDTDELQLPFLACRRKCDYACSFAQEFCSNTPMAVYRAILLHGCFMTLVNKKKKKRKDYACQIRLRALKTLMTYVAFFWEAPAAMTRIPWAITASVAFLNTGRVHFSPHFPKTGGGEDVDACLQVRKCSSASSTTVIKKERKIYACRSAACGDNKSSAARRKMY